MDTFQGQRADLKPDEIHPPGFFGGILSIFLILASSALVLVYSIRNGNLWTPVESFVDSAGECLLGSRQCSEKTSKSVALRIDTKPTASPTPTRRSTLVSAGNPTSTPPPRWEMFQILWKKYSQPS